MIAGSGEAIEDEVVATASTVVLVSGRSTTLVV